MEDQQANFFTTFMIVGGVVTLFFVLFNDKVEQLMYRFSPNPEEGFKKMFLIGLAIWVIVGIGISIYLLFKGLGWAE